MRFLWGCIVTTPRRHRCSYRTKTRTRQASFANRETRVRCPATARPGISGAPACRAAPVAQLVQSLERLRVPGALVIALRLELVDTLISALLTVRGLYPFGTRKRVASNNDSDRSMVIDWLLKGAVSSARSFRMLSNASDIASFASWSVSADSPRAGTPLMSQNHFAGPPASSLK